MSIALSKVLFKVAKWETEFRKFLFEIVEIVNVEIVNIVLTYRSK